MAQTPTSVDLYAWVSDLYALEADLYALKVDLYAARLTNVYALNIQICMRQMQICVHTLAICMHLTLICMHRTCHEGTRFGTGRGRSNAAEAGGRGLGEDPQNDGQHQNKYINCMSGIVWCAHHLSKPTILVALSTISQK